MYNLKRIIEYDGDVLLPNCMYNLKPINKVEISSEEIDLKISKKVIKFIKAPEAMAELENRQEVLLKKLDYLYDKIKSLSSICYVKSSPTSPLIETPNDIVLVSSADNLPWYLAIFKKRLSDVNVQWHIHSSVSNDKVAKIKSFMSTLKLDASNSAAKVTLRIIFKNANSELKLKSLDLPIIGAVNIMRYLSLVYPDIIPYDQSVSSDSLLDLCHILERTSEKNKEAVVKNIFSQYKTWIYGNNFSIADLAAYNAIKQWRNCPKYVPKEWFAKCEKYIA